MCKEIGRNMVYWRNWKKARQDNSSELYFGKSDCRDTSEEVMAVIQVKDDGILDKESSNEERSRSKRYLTGNQCYTLKSHRISQILKMTDLEIVFSVVRQNSKECGNLRLSDVSQQAREWL